jgi:hypothetical protein
MLLYIQNRRVAERPAKLISTFTELVRGGHTKKNGYKKIG